VYFARGRNRGASFCPNVRVDRGMPVQFATALDNQWAPAVAVRGRRIYVAWTGFRNYNWDVFVAHSPNGVNFSSATRIDDFPGFERIDDHPTVAAEDAGTVHAAWADRRDTAGDTNILYARSADGGVSFSVNRRIDSSAAGLNPERDTPTNQ